MQDGAFMLEVPNLIFCLHQLETEGNSDDIRSVTESLSAIYLDTVGDRIDIMSASNLIYGWAELYIENLDLADELAIRCLEKNDAEAFYSEGCSTELVNIVKSTSKLGYKNDKFMKMILDHIETCFDDLDIGWTVLLLKSLAESRDNDADLVLHFFVKIASNLHKKL